MEAIRQYILSVVCVAFLCAIAQMLIPGDHTLIKLVTGIIIVITVSGSLLSGGDLAVDFFFDEIVNEGDWAVQKGEQAAVETTSAFIREKTETYILNKATELGAAISADVKLDGEKLPVPAEITITGMVSPYIKKQLAEYIQRELGIAEENQIWVS